MSNQLLKFFTLLFFIAMAMAMATSPISPANARGEAALGCVCNTRKVGTFCGNRNHDENPTLIGDCVDQTLYRCVGNKGAEASIAVHGCARCTRNTLGADKCSE